ncbi:T9SS type A sorting domain-containing protein [Psychroserpens sp. MEBiC05023]
MKIKLLSIFMTLSAIALLNAQTPFGPENTIDANTGDNPYVVASGDLDGDTDIDLVIGTYDYFDGPVSDVIKWYANDGTGNFTLQPIVSSTMIYVGSITIADVDGINGNDIIATSASQNKVVYFPNDGMGGFGSEVVVAGSLTGAGQVVAVDINNDTNLDLAVAAYGGHEVVWYAGDGSGSFGSKQIIDATAASGPGAISFADTDGDTDLDIVIGYTDLGSIEVFYNQFIESGTSTVSWVKDANTVHSGDTYLFAAGFADIDDDGVLDIIKTDIDNSGGDDLAWYKKEMDGTYTETLIPISMSYPGIVKVADLNGDTYSDIVVTNGITSGDDIIWFESTGAGTYFPEAMISDEQQQVFGMAFDDFNGDSKPDIASVDFQGGDLNWFENDFVLSTNNFTNTPLSIFPNPAKNELNFKGLTSESLNLNVYDILGKSVIKTSISQNESLDISALKAGIYIIKFEETDSFYKFIKE